MNYRNFEFIPELISEPNAAGEGFILAFNSNRLLIKVLDGKAVIPNLNELQNIKVKCSQTIHLGKVDEKDCCFAEIFESMPPEGYNFMELRQVNSTLGEDVYLLSSRALHLLTWLKNNKNCSKCGTPVEIKQDENAVICPKCGFITYPRISPAIITAVVRDDKLLLAHNTHFKNGLYSVIAGFVEPGETLEGCVAREIREEVGIKVKNIKYFGSQPWPFPDSLMIGFNAEYADGEIKEDGNEIETAGWFSVDQLPKIPTAGSMARKLIEWFINNK